MPCLPASRIWSQSCSVSPTTGCPSCTSTAATAEESTPPDMATAMVLVGIVVVRCSYPSLMRVDARWIIDNQLRQCRTRLPVCQASASFQTLQKLVEEISGYAWHLWPRRSGLRRPWSQDRTQRSAFSVPGIDPSGSSSHGLQQQRLELPRP